MNSNFNRQFIMIDFRLLDDNRFIDFINSAEFGTYLLMRRHVWRGGVEHPLNLDQYYHEERLLVSAIRREAIAERLALKDTTRVSKHLSRLQKLGVAKRIRTGRESIYILGEWIDVSEKKDGSDRVEWFYLERKYGINHMDVAQNATSDVAQNAHQKVSKTPRQTWRKKPHRISGINKEINRETTVNSVKNVGNGDSSIFKFKQLPDLDVEVEQARAIADEIVQKLGDAKSVRFYRLIARKIPAQMIYQALSEVKEGARNPAALFTHKLKEAARRLLLANQKQVLLAKH